MWAMDETLFLSRSLSLSLVRIGDGQRSWEREKEKGRGREMGMIDGQEVVSNDVRSYIMRWSLACMFKKFSILLVTACFNTQESPRT